MKITVKKGLDISMKGVPDKIMADASLSTHYALEPSDYPNLTPKLLIKEGDEVKVKVIGFDRGKVKLSMKQVSES